MGEVEAVEDAEPPEPIVRSLIVVAAAPLSGADELAKRLASGYQVPVVDLGNHAAAEAANCDVRLLSDGAVALVALRPIALGEELRYSYGALSNDDFVMDYGFLPSQPNTHDAMVLGDACLRPQMR